MANMGNQKLKLLTLLRILEQETDSEQGLSMPQIIERLEEEGISAERKSIYRDLNVLRDTGLKIVKLPKRPVEYALLRTDLGLSDVMMLIDVVQSSKFLTDRKSNQLVKSLKDLTSERERKMLDKLVKTAEVAEKAARETVALSAEKRRIEREARAEAKQLREQAVAQGQREARALVDRAEEQAGSYYELRKAIDHYQRLEKRYPEHFEAMDRAEKTRRRSRSHEISR